MGTTAAAERKAAERLNRQVAPWRYRAELEHAIGVAACRALARGDAITRAELVERTVMLLVQRSNDAARKLLKAGHVRAEDLPPVETTRDEAAECLHRHFVTVTAEEDARCREFEARLAATGRLTDAMKNPLLLRECFAGNTLGPAKVLCHLSGRDDQ